MTDAINWKPVVQPVCLGEAQLLVGKRIKWKTPRYRLTKEGATDEREGIAIFALPRLSRPTICPEVNEAKSSQCQYMGSGRTGSSQSDRMIVKIERFHAVTGVELQPYYYAPRLSSIIAREI